MSSNSPSRRAGFTLVELLVVIAIIGTLVALLLPAVQAAREAARRSQCANNLRQVITGVGLYQDSKQILPSGAQWTDPDITCKSGTANPCEDLRGNILMRILPFIEQQAIYSQFDFETTATTGTDGQLRPDGAPVGSASIATFICPSSEHPTESSLGETDPKLASMKMANYAASRGSTQQISNPACSCPLFAPFNGTADGSKIYRYPDFVPTLWTEFSGPFTRNGVQVKLKQITDGLSNTIFMGEVRPECSMHAAAGWAQTNNGQGMISTLFPINRDTCSRDDAEPCRRWCNWTMELGYKSAHSGGVNLAMGDGSVPFVSENIDAEAYKFLGGKAEGELASIQ